MRLALVKHRIAGLWSSLLGSLTILLGAMVHSRTLLVRGHRQRVIGALQQSSAVDRRTVDAFIDRWLARQHPMPLGSH
ncbi:MAG: hypothetical protein IBJ03_18495 [Gemmatimonadaceae bacterium]|nr:hypothetical protein [Gemmatimonadaceae bacterium]